MTRHLFHAALAAGLAAVGWVAAGSVAGQPLTLAITLLIAAFFGAGALELHRFRQATATLAAAVADEQPPARLDDWLARLHPALRQPVRLRIEGERVGLPGPALTPFLAGLLVLLGMLGTFLGMVVTLDGTGQALQGATDLASMRASLSAPVKGLGLAFGTSLAGVAASAMLGLMAALCRRDRLLAVQRLDLRIATSLHGFSQAWRRDESFRLLQQQAQAMPALVDQLQQMVAAMAQQQQALHERLAGSQERFHHQAEAAYTGLASSVGRALNDSLAASARQAGATLQPVVQATMAGIAAETRQLQHTLQQAVQQQMDGLAATWQATLAEVGRSFDGRSAALVDEVSGRLEAAVQQVAADWRGALAQQQHGSRQLLDETRAALAVAADGLGRQATTLLQSVDEAQARRLAAQSAADAERLAAWQQALAAQAALLQAESQAAASALIHRLQADGQALQDELRSSSQAAAERQQQQCDRLAEAAGRITVEAEAHSRRTVAEIERLLQGAAEAPRAAAEVIAELRQKLSDSLVQDNALLDERNRMLQTLGTLLEAVNHAAGEQRAAIDRLVADASGLLEGAAHRLEHNAQAQAGALADAAGQLGAGAAEVAGLGEAFGFGVELFSRSSDQLVEQLSRIEAALGRATARSDEQLAYYVAQAREVIDLSIMSQKQIVEDLQQMAERRAPAGSAA
ncbi:DUF802 domain-containing protein [Aquincola tertiaricarbonis]|uniref:DUF802 domain-containing protein n=1 Tax=Aquincola tertiaricarbonis TaxID=391953 RepID=UPI000614AF6A|nr:DUF802 domain-containing protein [Aquincola tertiaricarbonis]